jgi:hypothetical protein
VLRVSIVAAAARLHRRVGLALVVVCVVGFVGASAAPAQQGTTENPEELWRAYPLEQTPTTKSPPPASERDTRPASSAPGSDGSDRQWILPAAVVAGAAAGILVALMLYRRLSTAPRSARSRNVDVAPPTPPPAVPPSGAERPAQPARPSTGDRSPAAGKAPVCQVRWSRRGACFFAVVSDADGAERQLARSPRVEWRGPSPPEESPEAQAALRQLAKQLRDKGWRPLRAKGIDFDERQWNARRFRRPTEVEDEASASAPPRQPATGPEGARGSVNTGGRSR